MEIYHHFKQIFFLWNNFLAKKKIEGTVTEPFIIFFQGANFLLRFGPFFYLSKLTLCKKKK